MNEKPIEKVTATVLQEDIDKATCDYSKTYMISTSCVVYQVAKRIGLNPSFALAREMTDEEGFTRSYCENAQYIALGQPSDWPKSLGKEVTFTLQ